MSVVVDDTRIRLIGRCLAEDAEALLSALEGGPERVVDLNGVQKLHLAVVQVLLSARPEIDGAPDNTFLERHVLNLLR